LNYHPVKVRFYVLCTAFEDNSGAFEMARSPKMRPRTKHLNIKYHHFRDEVNAGNIIIEQVETADQQADIFTKALGNILFKKFRKLIMGWDMTTDTNENDLNQRECDEKQPSTKIEAIM
jgi:hypothetical protein